MNTINIQDEVQKLRTYIEKMDAYASANAAVNAIYTAANADAYAAVNAIYAAAKADAYATNNEIDRIRNIAVNYAITCKKRFCIRNINEDTFDEWFKNLPLDYQ